MIKNDTQAWCYEDKDKSMTKTYESLNAARRACLSNQQCTMVIMFGDMRIVKDDDYEGGYGIGLCKGMPTTSTIGSTAWIKSKFTIKIKRNDVIPYKIISKV